MATSLYALPCSVFTNHLITRHCIVRDIFGVVKWLQTCARLEVNTAVTTPHTVLWDVTLRGEVQIYGRFGWNCCLQFQDRSRSRSVRNVSRLLPDSRLHTPSSHYSTDRLICRCFYRVLASVVGLILRNHKECILETCFRMSLRSMDPDDRWSFFPTCVGSQT